MLEPEDNAPKPDDTHETAPTQFVQSGDVRFAYRRFGPRGATPLLLCNYFAANMDDWDPKVTNGFAAEHDVILFDNPGIGRSPGETPSTVAALTKHCVAFCRAIGLTQFDVIGFSLGGMMAQQLGAEYPDLLRRIILLGTGPRGGEGMVFDDLSVDELDDTSALLMKAFFTQSEASQASGRSYIERLKSRNTDRDRPVSKQSALAELAAIREWGVIPASDRFAMLNKIRHPTDCPREQGCRGHADQRIPTGRAPAQCSTDHVSGLQPWCTISARGSLSSACEVVSAVTARSISFWQGEIHS